MGVYSRIRWFLQSMHLVYRCCEALLVDCDSYRYESSVSKVDEYRECERSRESESNSGSGGSFLKPLEDLHLSTQFT
jgi:hypothetical protein